MTHIGAPRRELALGWMIAWAISCGCGDDEARRQALAEADGRARIARMERAFCESEVEGDRRRLANAEDQAARAESEVALDRDLVARMEPGPLRERQEAVLERNLARAREHTERAESLRSAIAAREAECERTRQELEAAEREIAQLSGEPGAR